MLLWKGRTEELSGRERDRRGRKEDLDAIVVLLLCSQGATIGLLSACCLGFCELSRAAPLNASYGRIDGELSSPVDELKEKRRRPQHRESQLVWSKDGRDLTMSS